MVRWVWSFVENKDNAYTMNAHLDEYWFGDTLHPRMVKELRTKIWDFPQVNSCLIGSGPNLEVVQIETGARMQNSPTKTPAPTKFTFHLKRGRTTFKSFYFSCFLLSFSYFNFPSFFSLQKVRAETIITLKTFQEYIFWWWCFLFLLLPMTRDTSLLEVLPASLLIFPRAEFSCFFCPLGFWIT